MKKFFVLVLAAALAASAGGCSATSGGIKLPQKIHPSGPSF